jgi:hypothetical protein
MRIDIVGLGLKRDQIAKKALDCIARSSGGTYYEAETAAELKHSVQESLARAIGEGKVTAKMIDQVKEVKFKNADKADKKNLPFDLR